MMMPFAGKNQPMPFVKSSTICLTHSKPIRIPNHRRRTAGGGKFGTAPKCSASFREMGRDIKAMHDITGFHGNNERTKRSRSYDQNMIYGLSRQDMFDTIFNGANGMSNTSGSGDNGNTASGSSSSESDCSSSWKTKLKAIRAFFTNKKTIKLVSDKPEDNLDAVSCDETPIHSEENFNPPEVIIGDTPPTLKSILLSKSPEDRQTDELDIPGFKSKVRFADQIYDLQVTTSCDDCALVS